jgi:hypothetical protein
MPTNGRWDLIRRLKVNVTIAIAPKALNEKVKIIKHTTKILKYVRSILHYRPSLQTLKKLNPRLGS